MRKTFIFLFLAGLSQAQTAVPTPVVSKLSNAPVSTPGKRPPAQNFPSPPTPAAVSGISGAEELEMGFAIQKAKGPDAARKYFSKAKLEGNVEADYQLYVMDNLVAMPEYNDLVVTAGSIPPGRQEEAFNHLLDFTIHSAKQGNVEAEVRLWLYYCRKDPYHQTLPDMREALKWLKLAAGQGDDMAEDALGQYYEHRPEITVDIGLPKDMPQARRWYALAAAKGNGDAQRALLRLDTEGLPLALTGIMLQNYSEDAPTDQNLIPNEPATLGGMPASEILLFPRQVTATCDPYAAVSGHLHWEGVKPILDVDSFEIIPDKGKHLVEYLLRDKRYDPHRITVRFKKDARDSAVQAVISNIGVEETWGRPPGVNRSIKLKDGMTMGEALTMAVNNPAVERVQTSYITGIDFE